MPIHPTAFVDPTSEIHESAEIGPHCHIGPHCRIGENNVLQRHVEIGPNTSMGAGNVFYPYSVLGGDPQYLGFNPATKSGVILGDRNQFREFSTVHRGLKDGQNTVLGNENYFMSYSHAGHDCVLANNIVLVNYAGLAGHVEVEDRVFISGFVGVHQFCRIGTLAMIGGMTGIPKDVPPYMTMKFYNGLVIGLNVVGLRRAGVSPEGRKALKRACKELFLTGRPLSNAIETVRAEWAGKEMPRELEHLLDFCSVKSKRGIAGGYRTNQSSGAHDMEVPDADDE